MSGRGHQRCVMPRTSKHPNFKRRGDSTRPALPVLPDALRAKRLALFTGALSAVGDGAGGGARIVGDLQAAANAAGLEPVIRLDYWDLERAKAIKTSEGWLLIRKAIVARAGVLTYRLADGTIWRELRDPDVIQSRRALETYEGRPMLEAMHPVDDTGAFALLTVDNMADWPPVGSISNMHAGWADDPDMGDMGWEWPVTAGDVLIWNPDTIARIESGELREFSVGYLTMVDPTPGEWMGIPYDGRQVVEIGNHVAVVDMGRAGPITRFGLAYGDGAAHMDLAPTGDIRTSPAPGNPRHHSDRQPAPPMGRADHCTRGDTMPLTNFTLNGVQGQIDDALLREVREMERNLTAARATGDSAPAVVELQQRADAIAADLAARDTELGHYKGQVVALQQQIEEIRATALTEADVEARAQARMDLCMDAALLLPGDYTFNGKTNDEIRADAVHAWSGRGDWRESELEGAFATGVMMARQRLAADSGHTTPAPGAHTARGLSGGASDHNTRRASAATRTIPGAGAPLQPPGYSPGMANAAGAPHGRGDHMNGAHGGNTHTAPATPAPMRSNDARALMIRGLSQNPDDHMNAYASRGRGN